MIWKANHPPTTLNPHVSPILCLKSVIAIKFCSNKYLPSGSCPSNAVDICASSGNYCVKTTHNIPLQYSVTGVNGCELFQSGGDSGTECHGMHVGDGPGDSPSCYPTNRNYCECTPCTSHSDCINSFGGLPTGCEGNATGSGDAYSDGFTAGKECGIDNCANALKAAYQQLGQCT